jgi:lipoate-protein ligase B
VPITLRYVSPISTNPARPNPKPRISQPEWRDTYDEKVQRGGQTTFHGPGQLVGYPILYLKDRNWTVREYVQRLENLMIATCRRYSIEATTTENTGVWVNDMKIGAIGVQASRYVTSHGFALNCNTRLDWYNHIIPCGLPDKGVTSISRELQQDVTVHDALPHLLSAAEEAFDTELISLEKHSKLMEHIQAAGTQA